jgi:phage terminase large subunit
MNKVMRAVATKNWSKSEKYLYHGYKVEITGEFTTRKVSGLRVVDAWEVVMMEGPIKGSALWFKKDELEEISDGEDADGGPDHLSVLRTAPDHPDEAVDGDLP